MEFGSFIFFNWFSLGLYGPVFKGHYGVFTGELLRLNSKRLSSFQCYCSKQNWEFTKSRGAVLASKKGRASKRGPSQDKTFSVSNTNKNNKFQRKFLKIQLRLSPWIKLHKSITNRSGRFQQIITHSEKVICVLWPKDSTRNWILIFGTLSLVTHVNTSGKVINFRQYYILHSWHKHSRTKMAREPLLLSMMGKKVNWEVKKRGPLINFCPWLRKR